jgi:hypothetical protein
MIKGMVLVTVAVFVAAQVAFAAPADIDFAQAVEMAQTRVYASASASASNYASASASAPAAASSSGSKRPRPSGSKGPKPKPKPRKPGKGEVTQITSTIKFALSLPITAAEFKTKKSGLEKDMAKQVKVPVSAVTATISTRLAAQALLQNTGDVSVDTILAERRSSVKVEFSIVTKATGKDAASAQAAAKKLEDRTKAAVNTIAAGGVKLAGVTVAKQAVTFKVTQKTEVIKEKKSGVNHQASASGVFFVAMLSTMYLCKAN